ncbi:MAG: hypothetical protein H6739_40655 [Alphaproteobacteria bacterium]|nr:hypothetical protein [Alphaproteobacteria bacterium]
MLSTLLLVLTTATAAEVRLEVVAPSAMRSMRLQAQTTWLGEPRTLDLLDDGSRDGDTPGDGLWTGTWSGDPVQALAITLTARTTPEAEEVVLYEGTEVITASADRLSWQLHLGPPPRAERTALPLAGPAIARDGTLQVVAATGWVIVLLNYVGWLLVPVLRRQREDGEA